MQEGKPKPRTRRRKAARPSELTAAALGLFVEKGYAATRLDEVAARAGVSKGTLYLYFDSKEALFKAVITMGIGPVMERGEALFAELRHDPVALLRALLGGWWEMVGATELAGIPKLMIAEARNFPDLARFYYDEVISRGRALVAGAFSKHRTQAQEYEYRYRQRHKIENSFARLKDWRRVATRYDRCPKVFLSACALAAVVIVWL